MEAITVAVLKVRLGAPISTTAKEHGLKPTTLTRAVKNYKRPDREVVEDVLLEATLDILLSNPNGSQLSGIVAAIKSTTAVSTEDLMDMLNNFADAKNTQPELSEEEV